MECLQPTDEEDPVPGLLIPSKTGVVVGGTTRRVAVPVGGNPLTGDLPPRDLREDCQLKM